MNWIIPDNPPPNPDCFIILSYALKDKSTPTRPTRALIEFAAKLQQKFPNAKIIMSTGDNQKLGVSNAAVMAAYARSRGPPPQIKAALSDPSGSAYPPGCGHGQKNGLDRSLLVLGLLAG